MIVDAGEAIYSLLMANNSVKAITARCYPEIPQNPSLPLIAYYQISGVREHDLEGPVGMAVHRYQVDSLAETYAGARELGRAVEAALDGYRGVVDDFNVHSILLVGERTAWEPGLNLHRIIQDYSITCK